MTLIVLTDSKLVRLRSVANRMQNIQAFRDATSGLALALFEWRDEISAHALAAKVTADLREAIGTEARAIGSDLSPQQLDEIAASVGIAALDIVARMHEGGSA